MQLNLKTDYALRMLMTLAHAEGVVSVDWIAEKHGVSRNHLAKVAQDLSAAGYVETIRGRGGGLRLAKKPDQINIGTVVRQLENLDGFVECMGGKGNCMLIGICGLTPVLADALEAFLSHLDGHTLESLTARRGEAHRQLFAV